MSEIIDDPITKRSETEINKSVGNNSRKQERAGKRNDKSYSQLERKTDYEIYNPEIINDISFSINVERESGNLNLNVGEFYPIIVTVNTENGNTQSIANVPSSVVIYESSDISKAYVKDGILYTCGVGMVNIRGGIYTKNAEDKDVYIYNDSSLSSIVIS